MTDAASPSDLITLVVAFAGQAAKAAHPPAGDVAYETLALAAIKVVSEREGD